MFSKELLSLLLRVITSWQVIAVSVVIVLYLFLVSYVGNPYHRPRSVSSFPSRPKKKKEKPAPVASGDAGGESKQETNDDLGLEESE
jgi:hypothetical protein